MGDGLGVVEPHGVLQPQPVDLVDGGIQIAQVFVEVNPVEHAAQLVMVGRTVGDVGCGQPGGAGGGGRGDGPHEVRDG